MSLQTILHVEDDEDIQAVSQIALETFGGLNVVQFDRGEEAVSKVEQIKPDLLLLDAMMPGFSGIETLDAIRKITSVRDIPAIFMTAKVQKDDIAEFLEHGAIGVVFKPFDPMSLADQIRELYEEKGGKA